MKLRFLLGAVLGLVPLSAWADSSTHAIFSASKGMVEPWSFVGWMGVEPKAAEGEGRSASDKALRVNLGVESTSSWAGFRFLPQWGRTGLSLTPELKQRGVIEGYINTPPGRRSGNIQLQIRVAFKDAAGKELAFKQKYPFQSLDRFLEKRKVDADEKSWQRFEIPIKDWLAQVKDADSAVTLDDFAIQFIQSPESELLFTDVAIVTPEKP